MFNKVYIDISCCYRQFPGLDYVSWGTEEIPDEILNYLLEWHEDNLYPNLYLIADEIYESGFDHFSGEKNRYSSYDINNRPSFVKPLEDPLTVIEGPLNFKDNMPKNLVKAVHDPKGIYFTPSQRRRQFFLQKRGLDADTAILILAASGLEIALPNIFPDITASDELAQIRNTLEEERTKYVTAMTRLADESFDRLVNGVYQDTFSWGASEATFKIQPLVTELEKSISKLDKKLIKRSDIQFFKDGVPAIGSTLFEKGIKEAGLKACSEILKVFCTGVSEKIEYQRNPIASYILKVKKLIKK